MFIYTGAQLLDEIETDYNEFGKSKGSAAEFYGEGYDEIEKDWYYLVTSELVILAFSKTKIENFNDSNESTIELN